LIRLICIAVKIWIVHVRYVVCVHVNSTMQHFFLIISDTMYMHRTCSHRLNDFKIMMSDGVCRSERQGDGYLCMCGKHLCNSAEKLHSGHYSVSFISFMIILLFYNQCFPVYLYTWSNQDAKVQRWRTEIAVRKLENLYEWYLKIK
jgi:hypothetical protein